MVDVRAAPDTGSVRVRVTGCPRALYVQLDWATNAPVALYVRCSFGTAKLAFQSVCIVRLVAGMFAESILWTGFPTASALMSVCTPFKSVVTSGQPFKSYV